MLAEAPASAFPVFSIGKIQGRVRCAGSGSNATNRILAAANYPLVRMLLWIRPQDCGGGELIDSRKTCIVKIAATHFAGQRPLWNIHPCGSA